MIINLFLAVFLVFMIYWWSVQGLFSGLMHLVSVIVAGSLAFALWEPITNGLFMRAASIAPYAWGLGLVVPFVFFLTVLRVLGDKFIGRNMYFQPIISQVGGGLAGLFIGILTSGIAIIGISFMHVGASFAGYQPVLIDGTGEVAPNDGGGLWVGVDSMTVNFFSKLSAGAFSNATPMKTHQPHLTEQAALFRMAFDPNASVVVLPDTVEATGLYIQPTPVPGLTNDARAALGAPGASEGSQLVVVDTKWTGTYGTYDQDQTLRISPTQIRLVTETTLPSGSVESTLHKPIAAATMLGPTAPRTLVAFDDDQTQVAGLNQEDIFGFTFLIPTGQTPRFLMVRHTRLALPVPITDDPATVVAAMGTPGAKAASATTTDDPNLAAGVSARTGRITGSQAFEAEVTNELPRKFATSAVPTGIQYDAEAGEIIDGFGVVKPPEGRLGTKSVINSVQTPGHKAMVRISLTRDRAQSLLGSAVAAAASLAGPELTDTNGNIYQPIGYIWQKSDGQQEIKIDRTQLIRSSRQLPVRNMGGDDTIYLYFLVNRGSTITQYAVGQTRQEMNLSVR